MAVCVDFLRLVLSFVSILQGIVPGIERLLNFRPYPLHVKSIYGRKDRFFLSSALHSTHASLAPPKRLIKKLFLAPAIL